MVTLKAVVLAGCLFALAPVCLPAQRVSWDEAIRAGDAALAARQYERAEQLYEAARGQAEAFGAGDVRKAQTLVRLARLYRRQGDYAKPEELYRQALARALEALGPADVEYARILNEVGRYYHARRKHDLAEQYYRDAFGIRVRALGKEHPDVAESINNLAVLYENQARYPKAEVYYEHALQIREAALGPQHLQTIETAEHFARLLFKMQRSQEADKLMDRALEVRRRRVAEIAGEAPSNGPAANSAAGVQPPQLRERIDPEYTEEARIARHEGSVVLQATIASDGRVEHIELLRMLGLGLDEKAAEAARQWQFRPARAGNREVPFRATLEIHFRLL